MLKVVKKETENGTFYYTDIQTNLKGYKQRIWINKQMIEHIKEIDGALYLQLPIKNCQLEKGKTGLVLKQGDKNLFMFCAEAGYKGRSKIEKIDAYGHPADVYRFYVNNKVDTISEAVLVLTTTDKIKVQWERSGRLHGDYPNGTTILYIDGTEENVYGTSFEDIEKLKSILGGVR
jgi:hypothetical protein